MSDLAAHRLEDEDFECLRGLVYQHAGIHLDDSKRQLVVARVGRRLRRLSLGSYSEYCRLVSKPDAPELETFINALTTNLTYFFREETHFDHLADMLASKCLGGDARPRLRVWSAGCSSGEEAYCIAMILTERLPPECDWRVLATDVDSSMVELARRGVYPMDRTARVPKERLKRWFQRGVGSNAGTIRVRDALRERVVFKQLNLVRDWPMRGSFDAIFCRNVVIYFDKETQVLLFDRFADKLVSGGVLYVGHSETLFDVSERFRLIGQTTYEKIA